MGVGKTGATEGQEGKGFEGGCDVPLVCICGKAFVIRSTILLHLIVQARK